MTEEKEKRTTRGYGYLKNAILACIRTEHAREGAVPPPYHVAGIMQQPKCVIRKYYRWIKDEGLLRQPFGPRGPYVATPEFWTRVGS